MSYRYTDYGSSYPSQGGYHDNSGYFDSGKDASRKGSQGVPASFEPVRTYPSEVTRSAGSDKFNWHMLRTAVAAVIFCPIVCGLFGLVYAILSYVDFHKGNIAGYYDKKSCSLGWSVTGIVLGVLLILTAVVSAAVLYYLYGYGILTQLRY